MSKILIDKAQWLDPASGQQGQGAVALAAGLIVAVGEVPADFVADERIDAQGAWLIPALVDLRARPGMPVFHGSGALEGELSLAARYGVGSLVCPPDMHASAALDEAGLVDMLRHGAEQHAGTRLYPLGAMTRGLQGQELANMHTLARAGCIGFSQGGNSLPPKRMLLRAMQYAATNDLHLWLRPLDAELGQGVAASGALALRMGLEGQPAAAESIGLHSIFALMREVPGVRVHVQGLASAQGVALLRQAKAEGLPVTADVSVHSLLLTEEAIGYFDSRARLNPPLRTQADRAALQAGLLDGTIDAVVSDHTRVNLDGKALPFGQAQAGARSLELLLSLLLHWAEAEGLSLAQVLRGASSGAAGVLGIRTGHLQAGYAADVCLVDVQAENAANRAPELAALTPFAFEKSALALKGRVLCTVVDGRVAYRAAA